MIAVDTNVLVRYPIQDDVQQARHATELIAAASARDESVLVTDIVLCELEWVLGLLPPISFVGFMAEISHADTDTD